jgi:hypothetical protein
MAGLTWVGSISVRCIPGFIAIPPWSMLRSSIDGPKTLEISSSSPCVPGSIPRTVGFADSGAAVEALLEAAA